MKNRASGFLEIGVPLTRSPFACAMEALLLRLLVKNRDDAVETKDPLVSDQTINYVSE